MNLKSQRSQKNIILIILCAVLVIMGVGYAAFSSVLTINGTANITNSWCVGFDTTKTNTYEVTKGLSFGTTPTGSMSYSGTACETNYKPTATLSNIFYQPGDQIEYTLTIKNKSSVTAAIKSIQVENDTVSSNTTITKENITYIVNMPDSTTLASNAETTMTVIAKFQDDTPIESGYTGEEQSLSIGVNVEQDDGNGGMDITPATFTGTIYRWSSTNLANKGSTDASSRPYTISNLLKGTDYITENDYPTYSSRVTFFGKQYYIKHTIVNDEIIESYICFVYNNSEQCMKGGDGETFAANTQTIKDYQTYYNLNTVSNPSSSNPGCNFYSSISMCYGGGFASVIATPGGTVDVRGSSSESCGVNVGSNSACTE